MSENTSETAGVGGSPGGSTVPSIVDYEEEDYYEREREWDEYERLWSRILEMTEKFYSEIATTSKDPQSMDGFLDEMIQRLRDAGYCPPSDE